MCGMIKDGYPKRGVKEAIALADIIPSAAPKIAPMMETLTACSRKRPTTVLLGAPIYFKILMVYTL